MNFHFGEAFSLLLKTTPYLLVRTAIYAALGLGMALYFGLLLVLMKIFGGAGALVVLIGLAVLVGVLRMAKRYALYLVDAGHIAVITRLMTAGSLPEGVGQFQFGKDLVTRMFKEVSILFIVDQLVNGVIRTVNSTVSAITGILPIPGIEGLVKIAERIVNFSLTYVDETILSYNLACGDENIWESAKRGIILYAQNWKPILITAVGCTVASFLAFIAVFALLLVPFGFLSLMTHNETLRFFYVAAAFALAYGVKLALFKPFFQTSMIITFSRAIAGQVPNPQWEQRLDMASDKFRDLRARAAAYVRSS